MISSRSLLVPRVLVEGCRKLVEVVVFGPGITIADNVETSFGTAGGDVDEVDRGRRPRFGSGCCGVSAEDKEDDVGLTSLRGVDRAGPESWEITVETREMAGDLTERRDSDHVASGDSFGSQRLDLPPQADDLVVLKVCTGGRRGLVQPTARRDPRTIRAVEMAGLAGNAADHDAVVGDVIEQTKHRVVTTAVHR